MKCHLFTVSAPSQSEFGVLSCFGISSHGVTMHVENMWAATSCCCEDSFGQAGDVRPTMWQCIRLCNTI